MHLLKLIKLGLQRNHSLQHYRAMQKYIAECTIVELKNHGVDLSKTTALELASGEGGYSKVLKKSTKNFTASDIAKATFFQQSDIQFVQLDATQTFPFEKNYFDFIYCSSLIEHLDNPLLMLKESHRVLKPGGVLLLSFPPFYSLSMVGGHHFKPFHFLGERLAIKITNYLQKKIQKNYAKCYDNYGLYPLTIKNVQKMVKQTNFKIKATYTRMSGINTTKLPGFLADLFTWHVCFLIEKPKLSKK